MNELSYFFFFICIWGNYISEMLEWCDFFRGILGVFSLSLGEFSWIEWKVEVRMMGLNLNE